MCGSVAQRLEARRDVQTIGNRSVIIVILKVQHVIRCVYSSVE
jgi:hypothetical protein